jgi:hypothetical protein
VLALLLTCGGATHADEAQPGLSPRAEAIRKKFETCGLSTEGACREYSELVKLCLDRSNWSAPDCIAVREANTVMMRELQAKVRKYDQRDREKCRAGNDPDACERVTCPATLLVEGGDAEVRACSKYRNLPSASTWAQFEQRTTREGRWSGNFICLRMVETRNLIGEPIAMRPSVIVREATTRANAYEVSSIRGQTFLSREAAATAGCEAAVAAVTAAGTAT